MGKTFSKFLILPILFSYVLGTIASYGVQFSAMSSKNDKELFRNFKKFFKKELVSNETQIKTLMAMNQRSVCASVNKILKKLPLSLQEDLLYSIFEKPLKRVKIFELEDVFFFRNMASHLEEAIFSKGEVIFQEGNLVPYVYIVCSGKVFNMIIK